MYKFPAWISPTVITATPATFFLTNPAISTIIPCTINAAVAKLADARDLKSLGGQLPYRFNSGQRHQKYKRPAIRPVFFCHHTFNDCLLTVSS